MSMADTTSSGSERLLAPHPLRSIVAIILAVCAPLICAWHAESTGRWDLFERSGSITTTIGLLLASRRYVRHSVWGWGGFLGWWSFSYFAVWALFAIRDLRHDFVRLHASQRPSAGGQSRTG